MSEIMPFEAEDSTSDVPQKVVPLHSLTDDESEKVNLISSSRDNKNMLNNPILVEIIGATNLSHPKKKNLDKLDPFVFVKLHRGKKVEILTRTKRKRGTCDPIWCVEHRCLFLLDVSNDMVKYDDDQSSSSCKLEFDVRHKDSIDFNSCTSLGSASIDINTVISNCTEERIELKLKGNQDSESDSIIHERYQSKIAIRFRVASDLDIQLMKELTVMQKKGQYSSFQCDNHTFFNDDLEGNGQSKANDKRKVELVTEQRQSTVGINGVVSILNSAFRTHRTDNDGVVRRRVKPFPDPKQENRTTYLSKDEMTNEMLKPSTSWIQAGVETSKSLGKLYVEILRCSDLPNMDTGEALGNLTDAFCCAIFEDSMVQTNVIDDELSPIWFPWTQRAFVFQMTHAFSPLFISANDFDIGPGGHDGIGRIAINVSVFQPNTVYTLNYKLYPASNIPEREVGVEILCY